MVDLDSETIDVINKVNEVLKSTNFELNHFEVGKTMAGGVMVQIDIRKHEGEVKEADIG